MLNETIFLVGGAICAVAGGLFLGVLAAEGALQSAPVLAYPGVLFLVMAVIFLYTGWSARQYRLDLLRTGEAGVNEPRP